jgi:hypothetical protein
MPKIVWKGISYQEQEFRPETLPKSSIKIDIPDKSMYVSFVFAIPFIIICLLSLFLKAHIYNEFPVNRPYALVGIILGISLCTVHELLHAIVYPRNYTAYIGINAKRLMFYMSCSAPLKKRRFILMSLLPTVLGIIPLLLFIISPIEYKIFNAIIWPIAMVGLVSPCPDYLNVYHVLKEVPNNSYIQDGDDGIYWYSAND